MAKNFRIAESLALPPEAVTQTFAVLAKRGAGKTYLTSVVAEEMLAAGHQVVIIDPTGAWWGLRASANGRDPGFPIVVLGGQRGDIPLVETAGETIAQAIVDNRFSAVVDLSLLRKGQLMRFMIAFAETLYRVNRAPLHLFVDEADAVAPQGRQGFGGDESRVLGAMEDIVRRGRLRGIGCTLITQRPAVLNKNVLTQCESLFVLRLVHPRDIDAIGEWVNVHAEPGEAKAVIDSLPSLPIGTAWFWSPGWLGKLQRIKVRLRKTFDSSATPKPGQKVRAPKRLAKVDLDKLGREIAQTAEQARENDPSRLRKRIAELEAAAKKQQAVKAPAEVPAEKIKRAVEARDNHWIKLAATIVNETRQLATKLEERIESIRKAVPQPLVPSPAAQIQKAAHLAEIHRPLPKSTGGELGKCERAVLRSLFWLRGEQATPAKVGFYADYRAGSGTFNNAMGRLRSLGLVEGWQITNAGMDMVADDTVDKPTGSDLREWLRPKLGKAENAILDVLIAAHPNRLAADAIGERSGYAAGSGTFNNALGRLRTLEAAEGYANQGGTKASDVFFE